MGFQKTRFSELVFFGCLVVLLRLRTPLRPSDQSDMFPYADPFGASLLDTMMSDMIFATAIDSNPIGDSSGANFLIKKEAMVTNVAMRVYSENNSTGTETSMHLNYSKSFVTLPAPTLLENNLPRALDSNLPKNSSPIFSRSNLGDCGHFRAFPGREEGERDFSHKFDPRRRPWYIDLDMRSTKILKQNDLVDLLNATNVQKKEEKEEEIEEYGEAEEEEAEALEEVEEEEDKEQIEKFSKHQTQHQDNNIHSFWLMNINFGADDHAMSGVGTLFNTGLNLATKDISTIFSGIIIFIILSIIGWKRMKNKKYFISNNWLYALIFDESNLDKPYFNDKILYENLLKEAILISEGSSGIVFKVMFYGLECAMKVFFSNARMDFKNESITVIDLDHPHIVNFFCVFRKSFIIMELMDGDLYSFITKIRERRINYDMPVEVALDVMLQIAEGMSYLHNQGIAHRDLKSNNILLKWRGEFHAFDFQIIAKIADFGSARKFDPRCPKGFVLLPNKNIGTRLWRAPELFHPRGGFSAPEEDCRMMPKPLDIYGFAIICSELITKQIPFSNNNDQTVVLGAKIRQGYRPALPSDGCPGELITLIRDCWQTDPCLRPEFREICTRLKRIIVAKAS